MHSHLHLADDIELFGHPMNWEASKGERGLKTWAKLYSHTAQKQSMSTFLESISNRIADGLLMDKLVQDIQSVNVPLSHALPTNNCGNPGTTDEQWIHHVTKRKFPHCRCSFDLVAGDHRITEIDSNGLEKSPQVTVCSPLYDSMVINSLLQFEKGDEVQRLLTISIYKDMRVHFEGGNKVIRASSAYDKFGPFFDWVTVNWMVGRSSQRRRAPAKLLLLYQDCHGIDSAIVQACTWQDSRDCFLSTPLIDRWRLEKNEGDGVKTRVLRKVAIRDIVEINFVVEHSGDNTSKYGVSDTDLCADTPSYVDVVQPRYAWGSNFVAT
jgi:hypothetical protein